MSLKIGRIIGVEIRLHYTWLIIFMLVTFTLAEGFMPQQYPGQSSTIYWITGGAAAILLFASVLFHELFHSYMAMRKGIAVPRITLFLFGGVSQIAEEPTDPGVEFRISVVGPLSSFALGGLFGILLFITEVIGLPVIVVAPLNYGFLINILLGLFNLLPAFPLDGGRILRARIWARKNDMLAATALSTRVSEVFAYSMMFLGFLSMVSGEILGGLWLVFIGWFLKNGAEATLQQTTMTQTLTGVKVEDIMTIDVVTVEPDISVVEAIRNYFYRYKHGGYPVVSRGEVKGIVTTHDIQKIPQGRWGSTYIWDIMTPRDKLITVSPEDPATDAFAKMTKNDLGRLPVMKEDLLIGIVTRSDIMRAMKRRSELKVEQN
ncbi:MAG: site-2 protease family protein [Nitrososphaerales archaeon]